MRRRNERRPYGLISLDVIMDRRVEPGDDARGVAGALQSNQ
jgi:hypothetical protein